MPKKKTIDDKKLIKMVQDGVIQKEIMEKFGFKTSTQFRVAYLNAAMESGKVPKIKSGRGPKEKGPLSKEVSVNKRGSLVIPKALVEEFGLKEGDSFIAKKSKVGIALTRKY
jgi:hypothetical protein